MHDFFAIPDRDLDGKVFVLNDLSTDIHEFADRAAITFNGAVEWSLDWILSEEVVWLPTESQLRDGIGDAFRALVATDSRFECHVAVGDRVEVLAAATAADAYGRALLTLLEAARSV